MAKAKSTVTIAPSVDIVLALRLRGGRREIYRCRELTSR
jgi:hypothetical protein